jgi:uncharacterized phage-like protein YoqJ
MSMFLDHIHLPSQVTTDFHNRIIVATGHRPQKIGGYSDAALIRLKEIAIDWLTALNPRGAISGMALGWDTAIVEACLHLGLPYVACVPFRGQDSQWPAPARRAYANYLNRAANKIVCSSGDYAPSKMQIRNERMVDLALTNGPGPANALVLAMWDGTSGGTKNCLSYARTRLESVNAWSDYLIRTQYPTD